MTKSNCMNGIWSGQYHYPGGFGIETVSFTAWFDDRNGILAGTILEPNTFAEGGPVDLSSAVSGERSGTEIEFTKKYDANQCAHSDVIAYFGTASADFTHVSGSWMFLQHPSFTGSFVLSRSSAGQRQAIVRSASVSETTR